MLVAVGVELRERKLPVSGSGLAEFVADLNAAITFSCGSLDWSDGLSSGE